MATLDNDNEFSEFAKAEPLPVPVKLFASIRSRLFPSPWKVFAKVAALHFVVGFLSLGICHQFGLNPFQTDYSLAEWFMQIGGHNFCMVACGLLFMSTTYILANLFLTLEELQALRQYEWLQTGVIGLVSLSAFYFFGAPVVGARARLVSIQFG